MAFASQSAQERAAEMLSVATTSKQLEEIVTQYPKTLSAQAAMLALAKSYYDAGSYSMAITSYTQFAKKYPKNPMVPAAELGRIHCMEASGQTEEALMGYIGFLTQHTGDFLTPIATLGKARALEQLGRMEEAKAVYEDFEAAHPKSSFVADMDAGLALANRKIAQAKKTP